MTVGRSSREKNATKGSAIPPFSAISRFCGFPIGDITLPVVTANASASRRSFGEIFNLEA